MSPLLDRVLSRFAVLVALAASLHASNAFAAMIDFETMIAGPMWDGLPVGTQFLAGGGMGFGLDLNGDGIADPGLLPTLEHIGVDTDWAFVNDIDHIDDEALPEYEGLLGSWMLRAPIQAAGAALLISYGGATDIASGQIWDIDGNPEQGTEQWRIDALALDGSVLESILSPVGAMNDDTGFNAMPWEFDFDREIADIWGLRIEFVGSKTWGLGAAFDCFYGVVPEPGTLAAVGLGLALLARRRR